MREFALKRAGTDEVLLARVKRAESFGTRFMGLMGRKELASDEGLHFPRCSSIHMFFMSFAIDVIYLDGEHRVKKIVPELKPWRLSWCPFAKSVLETPAGWAGQVGLEQGEVLEFTTQDGEHK